VEADVGRLSEWLTARVLSTFKRKGVETRSLIDLAVTLAESPKGLTINEAAAKIGVSRQTAWKRVRTLEKWNINGHQLCVVHRPRYKGRGYETRIRAKHFEIAEQKGYLVKNVNPLRETIKHSSGSKEGLADGQPPIFQSPKTHTQMTTQAQRLNEIKEISDDTELVNGARYFRRAMEHIRLEVQAQCADKEICSAIQLCVAKRISGQPMSTFRNYVKVIIEEIGLQHILARAAQAKEYGRSALYGAIHNSIGEVMGLKERPDLRFKIDLNNPSERKEYIRTADTTDEIECHRCGKAFPGYCPPRELSGEMSIGEHTFSTDEDVCTCLYVAWAREHGVRRSHMVNRMSRWKKTNKGPVTVTEHG